MQQDHRRGAGQHHRHHHHPPHEEDDGGISHAPGRGADGFLQARQKHAQGAAVIGHLQGGHAGSAAAQDECRRKDNGHRQHARDDPPVVIQ
ncbi:MAG: hypothetical protein U1E48_07095 [Paracoccaceae bacterium]